MTCTKQQSNQILLQRRNQKQNNDKKMYAKLMLNKLKIIENFIFIYIGHLAWKRFSKYFQLTCGPYALMYESCVFMCEQWLN
jgi:hypothetical protein